MKHFRLHFPVLAVFIIAWQLSSTTARAQWTANGVAISTAANYQEFPTIVSDGAGGAIITWHDLRNGLADIYAQRINSSGAVQWTANGVAICTAADYQYYPTIVSDGAGGAIITWYDHRSGTYDDIYAYQVGPNGVTEVQNDVAALPESFRLEQNYPNPFNPSTKIQYDVAHRSIVELHIFNTLGQHVAKLVSEAKEPGRYEVVWDGRNDAGQQVGGGVYFYRLGAGDPSTGSGRGFVQTKKLMLLR